MQATVRPAKPCFNNQATATFRGSAEILMRVPEQTSGTVADQRAALLQPVARDVSFPSMSFGSSSRHANQQGTLDGQTKSTASELSRDKPLLTESTVSHFSTANAKRHRQSEAMHRSRFAAIFSSPLAQAGMTSDSGFCHTVFPMPLECEMEEAEDPIL